MTTDIIILTIIIKSTEAYVIILLNIIIIRKTFDCNNIFITSFTIIDNIMNIILFCFGLKIGGSQ